MNRLSGRYHGASAQLKTSFRRIDEDTFAGHIYDPANLTRKFTLEVHVDGLVVGVARADRYDRELSKADVGDGCYGFEVVISTALVATAASIEARLANTGEIVGAALSGRSFLAEVGKSRPLGEVSWVGGLRLVGWIDGGGESAPVVQARVAGEVVCEVFANGWRHDDGMKRRPVRGFDFHLPTRFADGDVWRIAVTTKDGQELGGSPVALVAFEDGLKATLHRLGAAPGQRLQGSLYDRLMPQSLPFSMYREWLALSATPPSASEAKIAVVLVGADPDEAVLRSLQAQASQDWTAIILPDDKVDGVFDALELRRFITQDAAEASVFVFASRAMELRADALARFDQCFAAHPDALLAYADFEIVSKQDGEQDWLIALPAFDYERMLEQGYFSSIFALRRPALEAALAKTPCTLFRLANVLFDVPWAPEAVRHLPGAIARRRGEPTTADVPGLMRATQEHMAARGVAAQVRSSRGVNLPACRVRRLTTRSPVSIIVPTRDREDLLRACLESIRPAAVRSNAEIIVADNDSSDLGILRYFDSLRSQGVRVVSIPGPFNYSQINNVASREAKGAYLCFLNNDVEALDAEWLEEMLSRVADPDVGAVGAKLLWPSSVVQHGGVALGVNFGAVHAFNDRLDNDPGYGDLLVVAHECSAVTAACMVTSREVFSSLGGFDEISFPVNFNDVDYCLKLRAAGRRVVFTPHARLIHRESASRGQDSTVDRQRRLGREIRRLRMKWGEALIADPFYSPLLGLDDPPFSALAWPTRSSQPRTSRGSAPLAVPLGL